MSSTVQQHPKENEMSSTVQQHPKENEMSSTVQQHPKEDEMSSTVPQHPKEGKKLSTAPYDRKEKLRFRERNGAAYQVPDNWEELYEGDSNYERTPLTECVKEKRRTRKKNTKKEKGVEIEKSKSCKPINNSCDKEKTDYYTSLQNEISSEIASVNKRGITKNTRINRWNKKHQNEIEFDKSMLRTWVEHGVTNWAEAPKYTKSTDEKFVDSVYESTRKSLTPTLGDFMPKYKSKPQSVMVPTLGDYVPSMKEKLREKEQSLKVLNVNGDEVKLTPDQTENFLVALEQGNSNAKACFNAYNTKYEDEVITLTLPYDVSDEEIVELIKTVSKPIPFDKVPIEWSPKHSINVLNTKDEKVKLTPIQERCFLFSLENGNPNTKACVDALNIDSSVTSCDHYTQYSEDDKKETITLRFPYEMSDEEMVTFIETMSKPVGIVFNDNKNKPTLTHAIYIEIMAGHNALTKMTSKLVGNIIQDIKAIQDSDKFTLPTNEYVDTVKEKTVPVDLTDEQIGKTVQKICREAVQKLTQEREEKNSSHCDSCFEITDSENEYEKRKKIPLCIHGIYFQVNRFNKFYFKEAEQMLDNIPIAMITEFSDQVNSFYSVINSLHFNNDEKDIFKCNSTYCRWTDNGYSIYQSPIVHEIFDEASFEVKAVRVLSPRYRLKNLTINEDNPNDRSYCNDKILGQRYKKALSSLEFGKKNNLPKHMDYFINQIYRETFTLVECLPEKYSTLITKGISKLSQFTYRNTYVGGEFDKDESSKSSQSKENEDDSCSTCSSIESIDTFKTVLEVGITDKPIDKLATNFDVYLNTKDIENIPKSYLSLIKVTNVLHDFQSAETKSTSNVEEEVDQINLKQS